MAAAAATAAPFSLLELGGLVLIPLLVHVAADNAIRTLVFSTPAAKRARSVVMRLQRERDAVQAQGGAKAEAQIAKLDKELQAARANLGGGFLLSFVSMVLGSLMWFLLWVRYSGVVVATLPFVPPPLLKYMFAPAAAASGTAAAIAAPAVADARRAGYFPFVFMANLVSRYLLNKLFPGLSGAPPSAGGPTFFEIMAQRMQDSARKLA